MLSPFESVRRLPFGRPLGVLVLGVCLGVAGGARSGHAHVAERIVGVVGNDIILQSELDERCRPFMGEAERESDPQARQKKVATIQREVLDRMIDEQLMIQQAGELKVQVTSEDVDKAVEEVKSRTTSRRSSSPKRSRSRAGPCRGIARTSSGSSRASRSSASRCDHA